MKPDRAGSAGDCWANRSSASVCVRFFNRSKHERLLVASGRRLDRRCCGGWSAASPRRGRARSHSRAGAGTGWGARRDSDALGWRPGRKLKLSNNSGPDHALMMTTDIELHAEGPGNAGSTVADLQPLCQAHGLRCRFSMTEPDAAGAAAVVFEDR